MAPRLFCLLLAITSLAACDKLEHSGDATSDDAPDSVVADLLEDTAPDQADASPLAPTVVRWRISTPAAAPVFGELPFPDDVFLSDPDGTIADDLGGLQQIIESNLPLLRAQIGHLDGFGRTTGVHFFLDGPLDPATLVAGQTAMLVDLDALAVGEEAVRPIVVRYLPAIDCVSLLPEPGVVLTAGHRHAAIVTHGLAAPDGSAVEPDSALRARLAGSPANNAHEAAAAQLTGAGLVAADQIVGIAVYTTQHATEALLTLAERVRNELPVASLDAAIPPEPFTTALIGRTTSPDLDAWLGIAERDDADEPWPGFDNPGGIAHDHIAVVYTTTFSAPSFLDPEFGRFVVGADGRHQLAASPARVPVTFVIPNVPPPSAAGYPIIVAGHGLRSDRSVLLPRADAFAEAGFVLVGIDDVFHGARDGMRDLNNNFKGSYQGPDGIPDESSTGMNFFAGFQDMLQIRDHFRQTILDQVTLIHMLQDPDLDLSVLAAAGGVDPPRLDGAHIYWEGGSLGGMMGTITTAVEPAIRGAALHVPGGNFIGLISTNSALMSSTLQIAVNLVLGVRSDGRIDQFHPLVTLLATAVEPGDPISYAPLLHPAPHSFNGQPHQPNVLFTYALDDEVMPNIATHALMRAAGAPLVEPLVPQHGFEQVAGPVVGNWGEATGAAVQYGPANHGLGWSRYDPRVFVPGHPHEGAADPFPKLATPVTVEMPVREHIAQSLAFFVSDLENGVGRVEITAPAVPDFDGDGVSDADEQAGGSDPFDPNSP